MWVGIALSFMWVGIAHPTGYVGHCPPYRICRALPTLQDMSGIAHSPSTGKEKVFSSAPGLLSKEQVLVAFLKRGHQAGYVGLIGQRQVQELAFAL